MRCIQAREQGAAHRVNVVATRHRHQVLPANGFAA
jgi:hypothetical protein